MVAVMFVNKIVLHYNANKGEAFIYKKFL